MAWKAEDRRKYAPVIQETLRRGMIVRLAAAIDMIDPPAKVGRPRLWSTLVMLQALWRLARDGRAWRRLPAGPDLPPHRTVWSRFSRWRQRAVLDRALAVVVACRCRFWGDHVTHALVEALHSHRLFWLRMISLVGS